MKLPTREASSRERREAGRAADRESGSVLLLAVMASLLILGLGLAVMWLSSSSTRISTNITRREEAMNAAEAGVEHARSLLAANADWTSLLSGGSCSGLSFIPGKGIPLCDNGLALNETPLVGTATGTASAVDRTEELTYTVFIRNDEDEEALQGQVDQDGRLVVRSEGRGRDGLSYVAVEVVLNKAWLMSLRTKRYASEGIDQSGSGSMLP